ncbi:PD-(D/E)XK nuclease family protein [Blastococcus capsensis]|uniref:PD-(D/E)XK nuclease family protein n=1 Tax=Blastococcus capsensis TaxID=1564163 RepID=UPI002540F1A8|nr:PD-(D/E)XK nuclease family protein [Blastococcus capsensis]MDK3256749.1 PD-(D/E)XK nuclease family protein [Blastococcus capsensis]
MPLRLKAHSACRGFLPSESRDLVYVRAVAVPPGPSALAIDESLDHVPARTVGCHLNADTRRAGVRRFLELVAAHGADVGTVQDDGTVLEGFVDLVYRVDDGSLVIVDYKTDAIPAEAVAARTQHYAPQVGAYVHGFTSATGNDAAPVLIFLNSEAAVVAT